MRVLIACDVSTDGEGNPYDLQLLHALETHPDIQSVQHGTSWIEIPEAKFDIVHIQWPEALAGWSEPTYSDLESIEDGLNRWHKGSTIVSTVHNIHPHFEDTKRYRQLFNLVYQHSSGIIHFGESSKSNLESKYEYDESIKKERIIKHGRYKWFQNEINKQEARKEIGISKNKNLILSFGSIRHKRELNLLLKSFYVSRVEKKHLCISGYIPSYNKKSINYYINRLPIWLNNKIDLNEKRIKRKRVQNYVNASDVLFIPRVESINSGNVYLGFTFGKVVVGPNIGVIGEILNKTGNPTFEPDKVESASRAIEKGFEEAKKGRGKKNKEYSKRELNWEKICNEHVKFYMDIKKSDKL